MIASSCAKASLGAAHRLRALTGFQNRRYAKLPTLKRSSVVGASRSLRALRAVVSRPGGVLRLWLMSGASRMVLASGFAVYVVLAPAHPCGLPVRPPRGLPQNRTKTRRLAVGLASLAFRGIVCLLI